MRALSLLVCLACMSHGHRERIVRNRPRNLNEVALLRKILGSWDNLQTLAKLLTAFSNPIHGRPRVRSQHLSPCMVSAVSEEVSVEAAFKEAVRLCELKRESGEALSPEVPRLLRRVFHDDFERMRHSEKTVWNVTCMQPATGHKGFGLYNEALLSLPLECGRVCKYGDCCSECSRVYKRLATHDECEKFVREISETIDTALPSENFNPPECAARHGVRSTLMFLRFVERVRRAVAHEYGHDLSSIIPYSCQVFARRRGAAVLGAHADESSFPNVHYSTVLYLNTEGEDFEGGGLEFIRKDRQTDKCERIEVSPESGMTIMFSSGWENIHQVKPVSNGCRFSILMFFTTEQRGVPTESPPQDADIANMLWQKVLSPEAEGAFSDFLTEWHYWLAAVGS